MEHIVNEAPKLHYMFNGQMTVPLVNRTVGGGGRQLGATLLKRRMQFFAHFPGLKVVAPGTPADAKGLLKAAYVRMILSFYRTRYLISNAR